VRFADVVAFLVQGIWEALRRGRISGPLMCRLGRRLNRMSHRFAVLVAHLAKFGVDAPRRTYHRKQPPGPARSQDPSQDDPAETDPPQDIPSRRPRVLAPPLWQAVRMPRRRAWLIGISLDINCANGRLQRLLHDPEFTALLAASPRLVALLRPLCRMLAVALPHGILPPPPPRKPRAPRRRRWHPPRRADLLFLLRMGKPLPES
jgi:hypothetical protein